MVQFHLIYITNLKKNICPQIKYAVCSDVQNKIVSLLLYCFIKMIIYFNLLDIKEI